MSNLLRNSRRRGRNLTMKVLIELFLIPCAKHKDRKSKSRKTSTLSIYRQGGSDQPMSTLHFFYGWVGEPESPGDVCHGAAPTLMHDGFYIC